MDVAANAIGGDERFTRSRCVGKFKAEIDDDIGARAKFVFAIAP